VSERNKKRTKLDPGAKLPYRARARIDKRKLTEYALDPDKRSGKHKGFAVLGFRLDNWEALHEAIIRGVQTADATHIDISRPGLVAFTVDIPVRGPSGRLGVIRTGWCVDAERTPWLSTLIPIPDRPPEDADRPPPSGEASD
jgi:hypothetical protein